MLVRVLRLMSGRDGQTVPGAIVDVPADIAAVWIADRTAEPVGQVRADGAHSEAETAVVEPPSHAAFSRVRRRKS